MTQSAIDELKQTWTDRYVEVLADLPELLRFQGKVGRVVTVNENGMPLVDFGDGPWYDLPRDRLKIVPKPEPPAKAEHKKPAAKA